MSEIEQVQHREALGRSKGGFSTKIHLRCDGNGLPVTFLLTVGERHEAVVFERLMSQGTVKRLGVGRPSPTNIKKASLTNQFTAKETWLSDVLTV